MGKYKNISWKAILPGIFLIIIMLGLWLPKGQFSIETI